MVTGKSSAEKSGALGDIKKIFDELGIEYEIFNKITENPLTTDCLAGGKAARDMKADFVVGTLGFIVLACSYSITDRMVSDGFRHLIYGKQNEKVIQKDMSFGGIPDGFFC